MLSADRSVVDLRLLRIILIAALGVPIGALECSPNAFPVKNFAREVGAVQDDTRQMAALVRGPQRRILDLNLPGDLGRLREIQLQSPPRLYANKPVDTFLQELLSNSRIDVWENNIFNGGRGTATIVGDVENDLKNQRTRVLNYSSRKVEMLRLTIADSEKAVGFFEASLGLLVKLQAEIDEIRDSYMRRAFTHLSSCLASCAGPKGFDLNAFRGRFSEVYTEAPDKTFDTSARQMADGRTAVENLAEELNSDISPTKTESFSTTVTDAWEVANLKMAADTLADAKRGSWTTIGSNNDKINQAIAILRSGYQVTIRPDPLQLTASAIDRAKTAQAAIDKFLAAHTELFTGLNAFLDQYSKAYAPGCRVN